MSFVTKIRNRLQRELSLRCHQRKTVLPLAAPVVSFTFDDFPRSALTEAGSILRSHGYIGTYYTSFGLMGSLAPTGQIFSEEDLPEFIRQGHELGCHTYHHCHSWDTPPVEFEASIRRNQQALRKLLPGGRFHSFSYPISGPRPKTKQLVARHYEMARGGGQTFNSQSTDFSFLKAFFIEQSRDNLDAIKQTVDAAVAANGWLIFATHDVEPTPTQFGCTPGLFKHVVEYVSSSGAKVLPVGQALGSPSPACVN